MPASEEPLPRAKERDQDMEKKQRAHIIYSGQVQGVGFRFAVERLATYVGVTGFVKNLPDGTVEVVCEGREKELNQMVSRIDERMGAYISDRIVERQAAMDEFVSFEIRF
jgi:acylphosphatase